MKWFFSYLVSLYFLWRAIDLEAMVAKEWAALAFDAALRARKSTVNGALV
ncbi:hypothetical protein NLU14_19435 [Marinobacter sp. 71-i]|uniref:Uncharacterized protein n=1 Tax=Marinobacter iranensis TaxID=2962607 RepID=A0ABT5YFD6_9GAMM|nr:hypothetical protein [Marinobacter iranensis]MDF0752407.1 hypothetical protein [Marinobacter iranensis]